MMIASIDLVQQLLNASHYLAIRALLTEISVSGAVAADVVEKVVTNLVKQLASVGRFRSVTRHHLLTSDISISRISQPSTPSS
jgi:hypothetical protein